MSPAVDVKSSYVEKARLCSMSASVLTMAIGLIALLGWVGDVSLMKSLFADTKPVTPDTALSFLLAGSSLWFLLRVEQSTVIQYVAFSGALLAGSIGLASFSTRFIFPDPINGGLPEMALSTAVTFVVVCGALLSLNFETSRLWQPSELLSLLAAAIALVSATGYLYSIAAFHQVSAYAGMEPQAAIAFLLLSGGLLAASPQRGFMAVVTSSSPGGSLARRLLPPAIGLPLVLGWLRLRGQELGFFDVSTGTGALVLTTIVLFGTAVCWTATVVDRSDLQRQAAHDAYLKSKALERAILEAALDSIITMDHEGRIVDFNPAAERMFGYPRAEAIGKEMAALIIPASLRERHRDGLAKHLATGHGPVIGKRLELPAMRSDGSEFPAELTVTKIAFDGPAMFAGFVRDVTAQKRAEEQLRTLTDELEKRVEERTEELASANKELEAFTYSVSHDLRAPLRHIDAFSKMLLDLGQDLPELPQRYLNRISESVHRMNNLIEDLLALAQVSRQDLTRRATGLNSIVNPVVEELQRDTAGRNIEWRVSDMPLVECDPILMRQVFRNLLENAVKFTRPRNIATIDVGAIEETGQAVVYVRDNGVGFSMKYADKLFGVFERLHRQEDFEGTGVGLAIVERIVHRHAGRVWAEAEPNKGATFYLTLKTPQSERGQHHD